MWRRDVCSRPEWDWGSKPEHWEQQAADARRRMEGTIAELKAAGWSDADVAQVARDRLEEIEVCSINFVFYQFSESWDSTKPSKRAIVVGQFDLTVIEYDSVVVSVSERQAYDGKLGRTMMTETYKGYCVPNNTNLCFVMEAPKFYVFDERFDEPALKRTSWMSGYMLKPSPGRRCFHSPVYVEKVPDDHKVSCNVLARSDIDPRILIELDKAQPIREW